MPADPPALSVRFSRALRTKTVSYAKKREVKVSTAVRMIVSEFFERAELDELYTESDRWQRDAAWKSAQSLLEPNPPEVSMKLIHDDIRRAQRKLAKKRR